MVDIRNILCPIDFSDFSRRALDHAVALAKWYESTVTVLHVCAAAPVVAYAPGAPMMPSAAFTREDRATLAASMRQFAEAEGGLSVPVRFEIMEGGAANEILAWAGTSPTDLIAMGTHGRSGFERLLLGSVTEKVLRKASCPVLSVPRHAPDAVPVPSAVFKRILCAIDFSDCSMRALEYAMSLAQEADARLTVVHVIEMPPELPPDVHETTLGWARSLKEYVAMALEDRRERLQRVVPDAVRAYCTVDTVLATGRAHREILRVAAEQASDLIVAGIHGRAPADLLFFGSTAQHLVRQASCPVLTLRQE
jgi:nucleotide-binding universal stress UspA family protein